MIQHRFARISPRSVEPIAAAQVPLPTRQAAIGSEPSSRIVSLDCGEGVGVSLSHYCAGADHHAHRHDFTQISFLLAGSMQERLEGRDCQLHGPAVGVKPAGSLHEDVWGRSGTLIFSLKIHPSCRLALPPLQASWQALRALPTVRSLVFSCFAGDRPQLRLEAARDVLALLGDAEADERHTAPSWLERARCHIHDAPDVLSIEEAAREAGVARAHLSRMFRRCYGVPPSVYRQRVLAARAVAAVARSSFSLSEAALEAGYGDQPHMNRELKAHIGITPGRLRRLLRG